MRVIDLTHTINEEMPVYPGTEAPRLQVVSTHERDHFQESRMTMYTHTGTHVDPPIHVFAGRATLDAFPPEQFIGQALVIDCRQVGEGKSVTMAQLLPYGEKLRQADFLLFLLGWDKKWGTDAYFGSYPCIDDGVLEFIMAGSYKGIGVDTISIDPVTGPGIPRHRKLFGEKDIIVIENLRNLDQCGSDLFWFSCFPLKLENCDGSPTRAVAWFA